MADHFTAPHEVPAPPGAESYSDLVLRAGEALAWLAVRSERHLVVVTHTTFLRTLISVVLLGDLLTPPALWRVWTHLMLTNTSITELVRREGRWEIWVVGDRAHLG